MEYLVFRLYGPMASWGEIAVGETRGTASYPSKSALCGLLGAAMGIGRDAESEHAALAKGYCQAVKMVRAGHLLMDYHTTQAPDSVGKIHYRSRRDELVVGRDRLKTLLSSRQYRSDALAIVALHVNAEAPYSLETLREALHSPRYHLYLGRKSCPLAAPLNPMVIEADGFRAAFDSYKAGDLLIDPHGEWASDARWLPDEDLRYYWEGSPAAFDKAFETQPDSGVQQLVRRDMPLSRQRWQFQPRREYLWQCPKSES